jgi:hypothetical protein
MIAEDVGQGVFKKLRHQPVHEYIATNLELPLRVMALKAANKKKTLEDLTQHARKQMTTYNDTHAKDSLTGGIDHSKTQLVQRWVDPFSYVVC